MLTLLVENYKRMLRTKYIVYALIAVEMKPQFLAIIAIMATVGLMTTAIAVPMLEDGIGPFQHIYLI